MNLDNNFKTGACPCFRGKKTETPGQSDRIEIEHRKPDFRAMPGGERIAKMRRKQK